MLGMQELIIILLIVVLLFGAKRIPEIMSGVGKGIKTFKRAMDDEEPPQTLPPPSSTGPNASGSSPSAPAGTVAKDEPSAKKIEPK